MSNAGSSVRAKNIPEKAVLHRVFLGSPAILCYPTGANSAQGQNAALNIDFADLLRTHGDRNRVGSGVHVPGGPSDYQVTPGFLVSSSRPGKGVLYR
ncbi:MAG: hypothetical protein CMN56_00450 [Sneathiella sp.]|nr:hypothetical protein [Sneathiella sp.]